MPNVASLTSPSYDAIPSNVTLPINYPVSERMKRRLREKKSAKEFQDRKRNDWDDNYDLYRNKVFTNRLTQRQAVNIPLIKETVKTTLSNIDDAPNVEWKELAGDAGKQLILQELWNDDSDHLNFEGVDMQDKKTVLLYGRAFRKLNFNSEGFDVTALDIYDVIIDPLTDPLNLDTARFVIHQNIFRSLDDILDDERYENDAKERLKDYFTGETTKEALVQSEKNRREWERKMERLKDLGFDQTQFPLFAGGDILINLTEHYFKEWNKGKKKYELRVMTYANETVELLDEKVDDLLGVDFYPFVTWGDDLESQDFWSDSLADLVRTPNKILNVWFSQLVENRTLRNFQMHWYDATVQGYTPQTYEPGAGRMLPAPGDPTKTIMPVQIDGLDETMNAIEFLTKIIERAAATGSIDKGTADKKKQTLGEIKTLMAKSSERTIAMMKFYRRAWKEFAMKWYQLQDANASGRRMLYKTSSKGMIWPKAIYPSDWKSKFGYKAIVRSTSEQEAENEKGIQKFMFLQQQHPNNKALAKIALKRELEMVDLTPEEMREVEAEEKRLQEAAAAQPAQTSPTGVPQAQSQPPQAPQNGPGGPPQPQPVQAGGQGQGTPQMGKIAARIQKLAKMGAR